MYIYIYSYVYVYIYIYRERERHIYIYIYIHMNLYWWLDGISDRRLMEHLLEVFCIVCLCASSCTCLLASLLTCLPGWATGPLQN